MMPGQTKALTAAGESETLEFKRTTGTRREAGTCCSVSVVHVAVLEPGVEIGLERPSVYSDFSLERVKDSDSDSRPVCAYSGNSYS